jgi:ribosomal protein S18 acetylase RimI-like enzyme
VFTLRPAWPEDEAFLFDLYASTRRSEMAGWGLEDAALDQMIALQFAGQQGTYRVRFPEADHHIILQEDRPIGRILVDRTGTALVLVDVALLPAVRGVGIGTRLVQGLQAEAAERGGPLRLQVLVTNPARRLYERLGFITLGEDAMYAQMEWRPEVAPGDAASRIGSVSGSDS